MNNVDLQPIDLHELGIDLQRDASTGFAWESRIYRGIDSSGRPIACKIYQYAAHPAYRNVAVGQVDRYQTITSDANDVADQIVNPQELEGNITWEVIAINEVGFTTDRDGITVPCAVSVYEDGPTLRDMEQEVERFLAARGCEATIDDLLADVTHQIREMTGHQAIKIVPDNVKPKTQHDGYIMRITDVCAEVKDIHT